MTGKIIVYGTPTCPMVPPVRRVLERAHVEYQYISLNNNLEARLHVQTINNGYESVPTLVFADGSTLTEPSTSQLRTKLRNLGYSLPLTWQERCLKNLRFLGQRLLNYINITLP